MQQQLFRQGTQFKLCPTQAHSGPSLGALTLLGSIPACVLPPKCHVSLPNSGAKGSIAASACLFRLLTFFSIWSSRKIGLFARPPCKEKHVFSLLGMVPVPCSQARIRVQCKTLIQHIPNRALFHYWYIQFTQHMEKTFV